MADIVTSPDPAPAVFTRTGNVGRDLDRSAGTGAPVPGAVDDGEAALPEALLQDPLAKQLS